jgi:tetratricopeptide (TPR) repeat protein
LDLSQLDHDELFARVMQAVRAHNHSEAFSLLKYALEQHPEDARWHYLLGAEYAQIGLYDRALAMMKQALDRDPTLSIAWFQVGLLQLSQGQPEQAIATWQTLERLDELAPLRLFSKGLRHLINDEYSACRACLKRGIALNQTVPTLNNDMQKIMEQMDVQGLTDSSEVPNSTDHHSGAYLLRGYATPEEDTFH